MAADAEVGHALHATRQPSADPDTPTPSLGPADGDREDPIGERAQRRRGRRTEGPRARRHRDGSKRDVAEIDRVVDVATRHTAAAAAGFVR